MRQTNNRDNLTPLELFARSWLEEKGLFDKDSDYGGMLGKAVLELVSVFAKQRHSGFSAALTKQLFAELLNAYEQGE